MSAIAAARAGAGYATVAVPAELEPIFEIKLTEVMSVGCPSDDGPLTPDASAPVQEAAERAAAVVLGPGLGRHEDALELARMLPGFIDVPMVIDADALNALAGFLEAFRGREGPTVLTPHAGELGRLLEVDSAQIGEHRLASATEAAERAQAIVVLKGDDTIIAAPGSRADRQRPLEPGAGDGGHRRRAQRHDRRPDRPRARAADRGRGGRSRPYARRPRRRRTGRGDRIGDRDRRDRGDPRRPAAG